MNSIKKLALTFVLSFLFILNGYSQEKKDVTYRFVNSEVVENIGDYELAFSSANMNNFRFKNKSNTIEFESGLKVEIFSVVKLRENGGNVDETKILQSEPTNTNYYTFALYSKKTIVQKFSVKKIK